MKRLQPFLLTLATLALVAGLHSCDVVNPAEPQPTYIQIDSFSFLPSLSPQNSVGLTRQIESVFVSYEGQTVGVFDLPARIPVLAGNGGLLTVRAGVDDRGRDGFQLAYPFYRSDTLRLRPEDAGKVLTLAAKTRYFDSLNFSFRADFEGSSPFNSFVTLSGDTGLVATPDAAYRIDGTHTGLIVVDGNHKSSEVISQAVFRPSGSQVFLEFDYRCNIEFKIGVQSVDANTFDGYATGVRANTTGAKFCVNIADFILENPSASGFRLQLKTELPDGESSGFVAIDNLKVVSF